MNFDYYSPTKIFFGTDKEQNIGEIIKSYGFKKVLFHYGKSSIKESGLYYTIKNSLIDNNIKFVEIGGVEVNPDVSLVRYAVKVCKEEQVDFILAVGGGSVIDSAKSISAGILSDEDPWKFSTHEINVEKTIPVGVVLTIAAAGSELSNSCVISNKEIKVKNGFNTDKVRPLFVVENPKLTYSVSKYQTACGVVDIMMHTLERYLSDIEPIDLSNSFALELLKNVMKFGKIAYTNPEDYNARANLMLASSFSHNGLTGMGGKMYFTVHKMEHVLSGLYDSVSHAAGLSILFPAWSLYVYKNLRSRFYDLAINVFGVDGRLPEDVAIESSIEKMKNFFKFLNMPTSFKDLGFEVDAEKMAIELTKNKTTVVPGFVELGYDDLIKIFELCK